MLMLRMLRDAIPKRKRWSLRMPIRFLLALLLASLLGAPARAGGETMSDEELYERWATYVRRELPAWVHHKKAWGEDVGWLASPMLRGLVRGYEYSGDASWLAALTEQVDTLLDRVEVTDGFPGWGHRIVGEALVLEPVLHFIDLASHDDRMPEVYRRKAADYLDRIEPALITKWEGMGRWKETHLNCGTFVEGITLPHNKNAHVGMMLLLAAKVTPSAERRSDYLDKAAKLARRWRKFLKTKDDHYIWHYWDAAGSWDFDEEGKSRHWTSLEHRGYGSLDVAFVAMAYDYGIVFSRHDVVRHCRTFLTEVWNGDMDNPEYRALGTFNPKYVKSSIYGALARFDGQILQLVEKSLKENPESWGAISGVPAYLLTKREAAGFERRNEDLPAASLGDVQRSAFGSAPGDGP
jgi:hypothetical protein